MGTVQAVKINGFDTDALKRVMSEVSADASQGQAPSRRGFRRV